MTSTQWVEYHVGTKRKSYNSLPTSNITAEAVTVDGFTLSQTDNAGVTTTNGRSYTATGMIQTRTDGRGNTTTTVTDAAGNVTTTVYGSAHNLPATVTNAQGNTSCYRYDARGRKLAEWGTGIQPVCFGYDDADRMTSLTTFRASAETISSDPCDRTDGDTTTWSYHDASGLDPTQPIATRPLAIQKDGTWYPAPTRLASQGARSQVCSRLGVWLLKSQPAYGCDLTKNIYELYGTNGYICTAYTYAPYGDITESGSTWLPIQWSSEYNDAALGLVYYNYRHYNPIDGRWIGRDRLELSNQNTYNFTCMPIYIVDILGEKLEKINADDISSQEIGSNRHHGGKTNCKINDDTTFPKNPTDENYRTPINLN